MSDSLLRRSLDLLDAIHLLIEFAAEEKSYFLNIHMLVLATLAVESRRESSESGRLGWRGFGFGSRVERAPEAGTRAVLLFAT